jgi:hypothetical protein
MSAVASWACGALSLQLEINESIQTDSISFDWYVRPEGKKF